MRAEGEPAKDLRLVKNNERCLKSWSPIRRRGSQARLASRSLITATFLDELGRRSKEMEVEREEKNRQEKNGRRQTVGRDVIGLGQCPEHSKVIIRFVSVLSRRL